MNSVEVKKLGFITVFTITHPNTAKPVQVYFCKSNVIFFLLGDSPASEFYVPMFQNTVCSIFIGGVSRKTSSVVLVATSSIILTLNFMNISQFVK